MNSVNDPIYCQNSIVNLPASPGVGPFTSSPTNVYPVYIDFSQVRSMNFHREYENVWRIANNTLTLRLALPNVEATKEYVLYATYVYNGVLNTRGGETEIFFS